MKINTYLKRKPHRECLKRAHELFDEQYPGHEKKQHKITMIKNQLLLKSQAGIKVEQLHEKDNDVEVKSTTNLST